MGFPSKAEALATTFGRVLCPRWHIRRMNFNEARAAVVAAAHVTPQTVMLAKAHILTHYQPDASGLIGGFVAAMEARPPELVVVHPSVDSEPYIRQAGRYLAHSMAAVEAIWGLVHDGTLLRASDGSQQGQLIVGYTGDFRGSGGETSGCDSMSSPSSCQPA